MAKLKQGKQKPAPIPVPKSAVNEKSNKFYYKKSVLIGIMLILVTLVFIPMLWNDFVLFDDPEFYTNNQDVQSSSWPTWEQLTKPVLGNITPAAIFSLHIDYRNWNGNSFGPKLTSLFLHLFYVLTILLCSFKLAEKIFANPEKRMFFSFIVALFMGIHPMHVESVAWLAERRDQIFAPFYFLGIYCYIMSKQTKRMPRWIWMAAMLMSFIISLGSKSAAVMFPITLFLIDLFFLNKKLFSWEVWKGKLILFGLSGYVGIITYAAQDKAHLIQSTVPYMERIAIACYGLIMYQVKLFIPFGLSVLHPIPLNSADVIIIPPFFYICIFFIAIEAIIIYKYFKEDRLVMFAIYFFLVNIILVLQLIPIGSEVMGERYTYVPYFGFIFVIVVKIFQYQEKKLAIHSTNTPYLSEVAKIGFVAFFIFFSCLTVNRILVWRNSITLYTDAHEKNPGSGRVCGLLALAYLSDTTDPGNLDKAIVYYKKGILLNPLGSIMHAELAIAYSRKENDVLAMDSVIAYATKALELGYPNPLQLYMLRGIAHAKRGFLERAIADFSTAIASGYRLDENYYLRSQAYGKSRNYKLAYQDAKTAEKFGAHLQPGYLEMLDSNLRKLAAPTTKPSD